MEFMFSLECHVMLYIHQPYLGTILLFFLPCAGKRKWAWVWG